MHMCNNILEIEADETILKYTDSEGIPIWMYMRYQVLFKTMGRLLLGMNGVESARHYNFKAVKYLLLAIYSNLIRCFKYRNLKFSVLFYSPGDGYCIDDIFYNRFSDNYASLLGEESITFENAARDWEWHSKRKNDVMFSGPNLAISSICAQISFKKNKNIEDLAKYVVNRIDTIYKIKIDSFEIRKIIKATRFEIYKQKRHARWLLKQCKKYNVKLLIAVGASYSKNYYLNYLLRINNIEIADLQHGYFTATNIVYNYSNALLATNEVINATPDYLLSYGDWWNAQTNLPYKNKFSIGNPSRDSKMIFYNSNKKRNKIVLIGCANDTKKYIDFADAVSKLMQDKIIVFRPHPSERKNAISLYNSNNDSFQLDVNGDLYSLFEETDVIIAEISTVLFESIGLVPRTFIWRTAYSRYAIQKFDFESFENLDDFMQLMINRAEVNFNGHRLWEDNWEKNFSQFIEYCFGSNNKFSF